MGQQEIRFQGMLTQVMQHVMAMTNQTASSSDFSMVSTQREFTEEERMQLNADYYAEQQADRFENQFGYPPQSANDLAMVESD